MASARARSPEKDTTALWLGRVVVACHYVEDRALKTACGRDSQKVADRTGRFGLGRGWVTCVECRRALHREG